MHPSMEDRWSNPEADDSFLQFRERSVRDGVWLSLVTIVIVLVYVARLVGQQAPRARSPLLLASALREHLRRVRAARPRRSCAHAGASTSSSSGRRADVALVAAIVAADGGSRQRARRDLLPAADLRLALLPGPLRGDLRRAVRARPTPPRRCSRAARQADAVARVLRPAGRGHGHGRLPGLQPRAPAARAGEALALRPADRLPQPPRLHRALRGGAVATTCATTGAHSA